MFNGSCVALVTPMTKEGKVDESAFIKLIEWHIQEGTAAIVVTGSTGESATLTFEEQQSLWALALKIANKRLPIIVGTGTNSTQTTIERTLAAEKCGATACLIVTPYYNRPTQNGLIAHYEAVANATSLPIILYNVPTRTGCDLLPETVGTLSKKAGIIGIKEATGNVNRLKECQAHCTAEFLYYTGDDPTAFEFMQQGGHGIISITANITPKLMQQMCYHFQNNDIVLAKAIDAQLQDLHHSMIIEPNPIPVKWGLQLLGKINGTLRLPLTPLSEKHHESVRTALQKAHIS